MNLLEFLKNGDKIHIKEKNKGSFTRWCGGNVTEECIRRGKASSNPKIRKKATFAANARKWKHEDGGVIKALKGTKTNWWQSIGNFLNSDAGNYLTNTVTSLMSTNAQNEQLKGLADSEIAKNLADSQEVLKLILKQSLEKQLLDYEKWIQDYLSGLTLDNPSLIVAQHNGWKDYSQNVSEELLKVKNKNALIKSLTQSQISNNWGNAISNIVKDGLGVAGNYLSQKK